MKKETREICPCTFYIKLLGNIYKDFHILYDVDYHVCLWWMILNVEENINLINKICLEWFRGIVVLNVECEFHGRSLNSSECHDHVMLTLGRSTLPLPNGGLLLD